MLNIKRKQITWGILLLIGGGYFSVMSNLEMHYIFKSVIAFIPFQVLVLIYVTYVNNIQR
jgi:hypothetical protein